MKSTIETFDQTHRCAKIYTGHVRSNKNKKTSKQCSEARAKNQIHLFKKLYFKVIFATEKQKQSVHWLTWLFRAKTTSFSHILTRQCNSNRGAFMFIGRNPNLTPMCAHHPIGIRCAQSRPTRLL